MLTLWRCLLADLPRESVQDQVPHYVYSTQDQFKGCPLCGRIYWRGTHWTNMNRELLESDTISSLSKAPTISLP